MSMTIKRTSAFPASRHDVFLKLQKLETLQKVAWPYATFTPVDGNLDSVWEAGKIYSYRFRLLGLIPFGTHTINVVRFDEDEGIYTHESNEHVPVWNHEITLISTGEESCEYTDKVEIGAGRKTAFIYVWAHLFYSHRQRKWIRMLRKRRIWNSEK